MPRWSNVAIKSPTDSPPRTKGDTILKPPGCRPGEIEVRARDKANTIISLAEKRAREVEEQAKIKAREESDRIKQSAQNDIDQQLARARESLRQQVSRIAIAGAEHILRKEVDQTAHAAALKELEGRIRTI